MGSYKRPQVFDPLDLAVIDLVFEAAWTEISVRDPLRDLTKDAERQEKLKKLIFAVAKPGLVEFDALLDTVLACRLESSTVTPEQDVEWITGGGERSPPTL
jgi:hypothetical protein